MPGQTADNLSPAARRSYPITPQAYEVLKHQVKELDHALHEELMPAPAEAGADPSPLEFPGVSTRAMVKHADALRAVLSEATIVEARHVAAIGRRVTVREPDGMIERYSLVLPGDGNPAAGLVSADSPIGIALLWATAGQLVVIHAPAGQRSVRVLAVDTPRLEVAGRVEAFASTKP